MSRTNTPTRSFVFSPFSSVTLLKILKHIKIIASHYLRKKLNGIPGAEILYLSLMKLAFAKQSVPESTRSINMPVILVAIGNWVMSRKIYVAGSLPCSSVLGRTEFRIILTNEMVTCNISIHR